jgi:hypothetical protein
MAYDNTNRGVLFNNDKKQNANHPDWQGNINVGGVEYWLSAWNKEGQKGAFISLSVKPKDAKPVTPHSAAKADGYAPDKSLQADDDFLNEPIPF